MDVAQPQRHIWCLVMTTFSVFFFVLMKLTLFLNYFKHRCKHDVNLSKAEDCATGAFHVVSGASRDPPVGALQDAKSMVMSLRMKKCRKHTKHHIKTQRKHTALYIMVLKSHILRILFSTNYLHLRAFNYNVLLFMFVQCFHPVDLQNR